MSLFSKVWKDRPFSAKFVTSRTCIASTAELFIIYSSIFHYLFVNYYIIVKNRHSIFLINNKLNWSLTVPFIFSGTWLIRPLQVGSAAKTKKFESFKFSWISFIK